MSDWPRIIVNEYRAVARDVLNVEVNEEYILRISIATAVALESLSLTLRASEALVQSCFDEDATSIYDTANQMEGIAAAIFLATGAYIYFRAEERQ